MGIFSRIGEILNANIHTLLDRAEDPNKLVRKLLADIEDALAEIKSYAAEAIAERIREERAIRRWQTEGAEWEQKAALAVAKGRDDLARGALEQKLIYRQRERESAAQLRELEEEIRRFQEDISKLEDQLQEAHRRQRELSSRYRLAENRRKTRAKIHRMGEFSDASPFERFEVEVERAEAINQLEEASGSARLKEQFRELEGSDQVEQALSELKGRKRMR